MTHPPQVRKAQRSLRLELHREPTAAELAAACGLKEEEVQRLERAFRQPVLGVGEERGEVPGEDVVSCDAEVGPAVGCLNAFGRITSILCVSEWYPAGGNHCMGLGLPSFVLTT